MAKYRKQKSRKVAVKRFKITKTGKVKMRYGNSGHNARKDDSSSANRKKGFKNLGGRFSRKIKLMVG